MYNREREVNRMNYTYILRCSDGTYYTGWTNDMAKRLKTHNEGKGAKYTRARLPVTLAYYEAFETKEDGSLKIMDDTDSDAAVTEAMKAALENEEVKNLIEQVQNDYQNALDADASLRAYVESIQ